MLYRGTPLIGTPHPPQDHHMTLGIILLQGHRKGMFLMSEVPLYSRLCRGGDTPGQPPPPLSLPFSLSIFLHLCYRHNFCRASRGTHHAAHQREISLLTNHCPLNHREDFSRPALRHGSLNFLFQVALSTIPLDTHGHVTHSDPKRLQSTFEQDAGPASGGKTHHRFRYHST